MRHDGTPANAAAAGTVGPGAAAGAGASAAAPARSGGGGAAAGAAPEEGGFVAFSGEGRRLHSRPASAAAVGAAGRDARVYSLSSPPHKSGASVPDEAVPTAAATAAGRAAPASGLAAVGARDFVLPGAEQRPTVGVAPLSREALLAALPARVVAPDGSLVSVRDGVAALLGGGAPASGAAAAAAAGAGAGAVGAAGSGGGLLVETKVMADLRRLLLETQAAAADATAAAAATTTAAAAAAAPLALGYEVTTVQVRVDGGVAGRAASGGGGGGGAPLIVKLRYDESVGALRAYVQAHVGEGLAFDLRCAYAPGALADPARSVREAGLTPNATLFLRFK